MAKKRVPNTSAADFMDGGMPMPKGKGKPMTGKMLAMKRLLDAKAAKKGGKC